MEILHRMSPVGVECRQGSAQSPPLPFRLPRRSSRLSAALKTSHLHHGLVANPNLVLHLSLFKLQQMHFNTHRGWSSSLLRQRQLMTVVSQVMTELSRAQSPAVVAPTNVQIARNAQPPEQVGTTTIAVPSSEGSFQTAGQERPSTVTGPLQLNDQGGASPSQLSVAHVHGDMSGVTRLRLASDDSGVDCEEISCVEEISTNGLDEEVIDRQSNNCARLRDIHFSRVPSSAAKRRYDTTAEEEDEGGLCSNAKHHCSATGACESTTQRWDLRSRSQSVFACSPLRRSRTSRMHKEPDIVHLGAEAGGSSTSGSYNKATTRRPARTGRSYDRSPIAAERRADCPNSLELQPFEQSFRVPSLAQT